MDSAPNQIACCGVMTFAPQTTCQGIVLTRFDFFAFGQRLMHAACARRQVPELSNVASCIVRCHVKGLNVCRVSCRCLPCEDTIHAALLDNFATPRVIEAFALKPVASKPSVKERGGRRRATLGSYPYRLQRCSPPWQQQAVANLHSSNCASVSARPSPSWSWSARWLLRPRSGTAGSESWRAFWAYRGKGSAFMEDRKGNRAQLEQSTIITSFRTFATVAAESSKILRPGPIRSNHMQSRTKSGRKLSDKTSRALRIHAPRMAKRILDNYHSELLPQSAAPMTLMVLPQSINPLESEASQSLPDLSLEPVVKARVLSRSRAHFAIPVRSWCLESASGCSSVPNTSGPRNSDNSPCA